MEPQGNPPPDGGQGSDTPEGSQKQEQPKHVTEEQLNRAITARFGDFEKRVTKLFETRESAFSEKLGATLEERFAALSKPKPNEAEGKDSQQPKPDDEAVKKLQAEIDDFRKKHEKAEAKAREERRRRRDTTLRQAVMTELSRHQISGDRADMALGVLVDAKRIVAFADDDGDDLVWRKGDEALPLHEGVREWVGTEQAKIFLPPRDVRGSGDGPGGRSGGGNSDSNDPRSKLASMMINAINGG